LKINNAEVHTWRDLKYIHRVAIRWEIRQGTERTKKIDIADFVQGINNEINQHRK